MPGMIRAQRTALRRIILLLVLAAAAPLLAIPAAASPSAQPAKPSGASGANDDAVIIIDISESVRGIGSGTNNIWAQVQQSVSDLIDLLPDGTNIAIIPFSGGPEQHQAYPQGATDRQTTLPQTALNTSEDRQRAKTYVDRLIANGQQTHVVPTLEYALFQLDAWRTKRGPSTSLQAVYIYTDGIDNEPGRNDWLQDSANLLGLRKQDLSFLWVAYVQIAASRVQACPERITCAPSVNNAAPPSIRLLNPRLDLPPLSATQPQVRQPVQLDVRKPVDIKAPLDLELTLEPAAPGITLETRRVDDAAPFEIVVNAQPGVTPGNYKGSLIVRSGSALFVGPNRVPVVLTYQGPPTATPTPMPSPTVTPPPSPTVTPMPSPTAVPTATTAPPPPTPSPSPTPPGPPPPPRPLWPLGLLGAVIALVGVGVADNFRRRFE